MTIMEDNLRLEQKIRKLSPFFDMASDALKELSGGVRLSDDKNVFEVSADIVYPNIVLLDNPYPIIQCKKRLFAKEAKIEVSYGIFAILGMLGAFEKATEEIIMYGSPYEEVWQKNKDKLMGCFKNALNYLQQSYHASSEIVSEMPEMTLHGQIFYTALKFIVGHELSHYLDTYFNFDFRDMQRNYARTICMDMLVILQRTQYKKYVDELIDSLSDDPDEREIFYENMAEEVLADYEGYLYRWRITTDNYKNAVHVMGISMAFMALRVIEYFETAWKRKKSEIVSIPVRWREIFLISILYKKHNNGYDSIPRYAQYEWAPYQVLDSLYRQVLSEIEADNEDSGKREDSKRPTRDFSAKLTYCEELIEKFKTASVSELENIFAEINKIFDDYLPDEQFCRIFPAEKLAEMLCGIGYAFYERGSYQTAYVWFYRAVIYFEAAGNPEKLLTADCYSYMGEICYDEGCYEAALDWYNQAFVMRQNCPDITAVNNCKLNLNRVKACIGSGKYELATSILAEMLTYTEDEQIRKEIFRNRGIICDKLGDNEGALEWFSRGLSIADAVFGPENLESATFYNSIGIIYYNMDKPELSEEYLMQSYQIKKSQMDSDNISLTNTMYSLGMLEIRKKGYGKAIEWFEQALSIRLKLLGEEHPLTAETYQAMGTACYFGKEYERALMYNKRAFNILKKTLGREHEETRGVEHNIELCLEKLVMKEL